MPMKPRKDEEQSDFMKRCMKETFTGDRSQEQAVAICMSYWREEHGGKKPDDKSGGATLAKQAPDPDDGEEEDEFLDRCINEMMDDDDDLYQDEAEQACQLSWDSRGASRVAVVHKTHAEPVHDLHFVLSDESVDRMGDIIMSDGWDIANFKNNPIALFNHNPSFPIGKWHELRVNEKKLRARLELAPKGTSPRIDEIRALVDAGILQATSVGFRPIDHESLDKKNPFSGNRFLKQELVETSLVSVPANANALAIAKSLNVSPDTLNLIFAKKGKRDRIERRSFTAKNGSTSRNGKGSAMSLAQRIIDLQTYIGTKAAELEAHLAAGDDTNVKEADIQKTNELNEQLKGARTRHAQLVEAEKNVAGTIAPVVVNGGGSNGSNGTTRAVATVLHDQRTGAGDGVASPIIIKSIKKDWTTLDYLVHAGVATLAAKQWGVPAEVARLKIYGDDEQHKVVHEWLMRAASAPAMTTVTGWAAELVQQVYADMMALLMPKSVFPRFSAKGLRLNFGRAGKIIVPSRNRTPTLAGSFVGEGMAIPVRQGAFVSQTFIPKKMAVITVWTKEMDEHSIPAIDGVLREAIQEDTAVAIDSVLLDANPATTIRPAGLLNGVAALTATTGGGITGVIGDIKQLVGALTVATLGNIRNPVWLLNPTDILSLSLAYAPNTGTFPFAAQIAAGNLATIPFIDSATVPVKTMILVDAADFVVMGSDNMRFEVSDQATLHMEDSAPLELVGSGSPGVVASPQRSLFQTDSIALRMILPLNWGMRRTGNIAWVQNVSW